VSFQDGPPEEIGESPYRASPKSESKSKWQPLSATSPSPVADHDPFSLGDSDDERDSKSKDLKSEDSERLKKAAAEAMADDIGESKSLEEHPISGTKDKVAGDKLEDA
jgi:hypothetical protein